MHELPQDLTNSLKSFRGSISGRSGAKLQREPDLEKGRPQEVPDRNNACEKVPSAPSDKPSSSTITSDGRQHHMPDEKHESVALAMNSTERAVPQRPAVDPNAVPANKPAVARPNTPAKMSVFHAPKVDDPNPAADRHAADRKPISDDDFHHLMGMRRPTNAREEDRDEKYPFKLAIKGGLFHTICEDLKYIQYKYRIFDVATYALLALQIIIGAVFIILGALRNTNLYIAIAVLGAVSTAIGGALALMKGQGLPNRLRQARDQLRNVVFEATELYWDFRSGRPIIYADIMKIREDYLRVLEEMRRNHPDTWTNAASEAAKAQRGKTRRT